MLALIDARRPWGPLLSIVKARLDLSLKARDLSKSRLLSRPFVQSTDQGSLNLFSVRMLIRETLISISSYSTSCCSVGPDLFKSNLSYALRRQPRHFLLEMRNGVEIIREFSELIVLLTINKTLKLVNLGA
jgi:hypothetical protein